MNIWRARHILKGFTSPSATPQEAGAFSYSFPEQARFLWHDPVLLGSFLAAALISGLQIMLIVLHPAWNGSFNQWLLTSLAWLGFLGVLLTAGWASHVRHPAALFWWLWSAALFIHASGWTVQMIGLHLLFPGSLPFPWWSDGIWLLQYPFFFLALLLAPITPEPLPPGLARLKLLVDVLLLTGAAALLSWYFVLTPIYQESQQSLAGKLTNLAYPIGDLGVLFLLSVLLLRAKNCQTKRLVLGLIIAALLLLIAGDSWYAVLNLHGHYQPGSPPSIFWGLAYLLFPLAGLVKVRLSQRAPAARTERLPIWAGLRLQPQELLDALRFLLPFLAALLASVVTLVELFLRHEQLRTLFSPFIMSLGLLALVILRQSVVFLDLSRLRRERETARANELAIRETARQMDNFLNIASHELRTPLTTTTLQLQIAQRSLQRWKHQVAHQPPETARMLHALEANLAQTEEKLRRLNRLASDLLDTSRLQAERLAVHLEQMDLLSIVVAATQEQQRLAPERTILLHLPAERPLFILADPDRLGQVITNYLTNALKYSPEDRPVEIGIEREPSQVRVWVRDQGPGVPPEEQTRIWERFHRAAGVEVQSGSAIGLGLGLFLSKMIVEQHHGQVGIQSTPGQGSTFWFSLPLAPPEQESPHLEPGR